MSDKSKESEGARKPEEHVDQEKRPGCKKLEESALEEVAGGASSDGPIELPEI